jgi:hypothetical protein
MAQGPDPFDVEALERSLNGSATRVSTIWITFLGFALYLVIAAGTVTHRQLLLEDPIKLPVLNVDLPLVGFFFLTPILLLVFHTYVLIQILLLGRTAAAYNDVLDRIVRTSSDNAVMRQRLANSLFAQIFAGGPRERRGLLGGLLRISDKPGNQAEYDPADDALLKLLVRNVMLTAQGRAPNDCTDMFFFKDSPKHDRTRGSPPSGLGGV